MALKTITVVHLLLALIGTGFQLQKSSSRNRSDLGDIDNMHNYTLHTTYWILHNSGPHIIKEVIRFESIRVDLGRVY